MTDQIGVGVIGMGWMGEVHSRSYGRCRTGTPMIHRLG